MTPVVGKRYRVTQSKRPGWTGETVTCIGVCVEMRTARVKDAPCRYRLVVGDRRQLGRPRGGNVISLNSVLLVTVLVIIWLVIQHIKREP